MGHNRNYIPLNAAKSRSGSIPNNAPLLSDQNNKYLISFKHYKENLCEISLLQQKKLKNCIDTFKRITQANIGNLKEQNIDHIRIAGTGEYKKLYNAAPFPDIEIFEHKLQENARIFYFLQEFKFYILAITNNHFETDKVRH